MKPAAAIGEISVDRGEQAIRFRADIAADILFDIDFQVQLLDAGTGQELASHHSRQAGWGIGWLPRGGVWVTACIPGMHDLNGTIRVKAVVWAGVGERTHIVSERDSEPFDVAAGEPERVARMPHWTLEATDDSIDLRKLSWNRGSENWFSRHFDHAAWVIVDLICANSPQLSGRVLDVGCGDGITDLGVFLRCRPEEMVGVDPSERYLLMPHAAAENGLPDHLIEQPGLRFEPQDANDLDFPDNYFDAVISWGSLEHIPGGYQGVLREIRRVLKPDGLFFCHPGLFYGCVGNHLGEFFNDPWIHLKLDEDELRRRVLAGEPQRIDRAGEVATPEQYWQWYTELNRITVGGFEQDLRALGFEPWRVALRSCDLVEYGPELQSRSFVDLATGELYLSAWNRK